MQLYSKDALPIVIFQTSLSCYDQIKQLPEVNTGIECYKNVHSQVLQDVVRRVDKSFKNFFRRVKSGDCKPGFPRYKSWRRYDSIVYPQSGWRLEGTHLVLSKIGTVKVILSRRIPKNATVKTLTITRDNCGDWFASFSFELENSVKPVEEPVPISKAVGVDVGVSKLAVLSKWFVFRELAVTEEHRAQTEALTQERLAEGQGEQ